LKGYGKDTQNAHELTLAFLPPNSPTSPPQLPLQPRTVTAHFLLAFSETAFGTFSALFPSSGIVLLVPRIVVVFVTFGWLISSRIPVYFITPAQRLDIRSE
jgi:hypothetical protein